jgi:DNA-binding NarL/FixJ family response regulator
VFFTIHDDDAVFYNALRSGARGYLLKSVSALELCSAVEAVASGLTHFTRRFFEQMLGVFLENMPARALSNRELGLVKLIAEGHSNKEIGQVVNLSVKSVEAHRATVMHKLNLTSVAQLVRYAVKSQLIDA